MKAAVTTLSNTMSLRAPQKRSLEILSEIVDALTLKKGQDLDAALDAVRALYPSVADFEREFPSLCFALATGVGKTRLMGAFIAYLHRVKGIRNFFVLAPNLTIYNKLIADFTPNTPKYVFAGVPDFAVNVPQVVTGENYEHINAPLDLFGKRQGVFINIFNISKINAEVRGGKSPRIKRLSEYIGESYFQYLSNLDDLVLIMDESHRYRASAGVRVLNELNPVLGLELTATPQVETGRGATRFKNIVIDYPLSEAMEDGYVKEPAVATREDFSTLSLTPEQLERMKLEDGIRLHEQAKVELETYARQNNQRIVKPFMLVIARDTVHAEALKTLIESPGFYTGQYAGRVITVHSNQSGSEKDETVEQLLAVEHRENPVEVVIHVNMLKEGWDVTNLYTIVPLRAADSRTLVEQSIGRGLRLPYGKRVGVKAVDRLTIVAHDRFQEIIDEANRPDSLLKKRWEVIYVDRQPTTSQVVTVQPSFLAAIRAGRREDAPSPQTEIVFASTLSQEIAEQTVDIVRTTPKIRGAFQLQTPEMRATIAQQVLERIVPKQQTLDGVVETPDVEAIVHATLEWMTSATIAIPRIVLYPKGDVVTGFQDFDLDVSGIKPRPAAGTILVQSLQTNDRERLASASPVASEARLEDYLVRALIDFDDVSYEQDSPLLYKLAGQLVAHLKSYLSDDEVLEVLDQQQRSLAETIHAQMRTHFQETATAYEAKVAEGFQVLKDSTFTGDGSEPRDVRQPVDSKRDIRSYIFKGFKKCRYESQKFDSDPERQFAVLLEHDMDVRKWFKPAKGQFQIHWKHGKMYEPDFVVETETAKYLCEVKRADAMTSDEVLAKAEAAREWCRHATEYERTIPDGKGWEYRLISEKDVRMDRSFKSL